MRLSLTARFAAISLAAFATFHLILPPDLTAQDSASAVEIQGSRRGLEGAESRFSAIVIDRPIRDDEGGYSPIALDVNGEALTAAWTSPLDLYWDFGDDTPSVRTGDRVSVIHRFQDDGTYTVTLTARDHVGEFAVVKHEIEVRNRDPRVKFGGVEIDPDLSIVEFTADAQDVAGDALTLEWDFGDGESMSGGAELWKVRHQYVVPGTYEVSLTVRDDEYGQVPDAAERYDGEIVKTETVVVRGSGGETGSESSELDEEPTTEVVTTGFEAKVHGLVGADFDAEIRSFRGIHLQQVNDGPCRFLFTAWDDANLAYLHTIIDLHGIPPEGAKYNISRPGFTLIFEPTAEAYEYMKRSSMGLLGSIGVGGIADREASAAGADRLTEEQDQQFEAEMGDLAGIDPRARQAIDRAPMPAASPLGIEERYGFGPSGGELELTFIPGDRASGTFEAVLEMSESGAVPEATIQFDGTFDLDLVAARRDGVVNYEGCEPPPFEVKRTFPKDGTEHYPDRRSRINVYFSDRVDPATVDIDTFEVGYTGLDDRLVPVPGRILREDKNAAFVPDESWLTGVRYTARIKAGDEGVRSRGGRPLEDSENDGWYSWKFTTQVDMVPESDGKQLLACHLYQTTRDVPLIPGKPAIARIYANWEEQVEVHPDHQVEDLETRVVLTGADQQMITSERHRFVRPDLWEERGIDVRSARHTAQVTGIVPADWMEGVVAASLEVRVNPGEEMVGVYQTRCPIKIWDQQPTLSIDFVALRIGEWLEYPVVFEQILQVLQSIADESVEYAWQLFPFAEIEGGSVRELDLDVTICRCPSRNSNGTLPTTGFAPRSGCDPTECRGGWGGVRADLPGGDDPDVWLNPDDGAGPILNGLEGNESWSGINDLLRSRSSADVIVAFGPRAILGGGTTGSRLRSGRGVVLALASHEDPYFSRYVEGLVHEVGHVLELEHLPFIANGDDANENRELVSDLREGTPSLEYEGIEGLRMSRDGQSCWNKSSNEGNQQEERLAPLMFPATMPTDATFISNHHYRAIQSLLEEIGN